MNQNAIISLIYKINLSKQKKKDISTWYFLFRSQNHIFNVLCKSTRIKRLKNSLSFVTPWFSWTLYRLLILSNRICDAKATRIFQSNPDDSVRSIDRSGRVEEGVRARCDSNTLLLVQTKKSSVSCKGNTFLRFYAHKGAPL